MAVRFRLLGPVEASVAGRSVDLGPGRRQCVLVVLLVEANRVVSIDQLVERVWADRPPRRARDTLYSYLSRLRTALGGEDDVRLTRRSGGYLLAVDESAIDLHRFRQLTALARTSREDDRAGELFDRALSLWRGEPFAGLTTPWIDELRARLDRERLAAELDRTDGQLRAGQHATLVARLSAGAQAHPLDERLAGQLMLALYRCGRQGEALAHYEGIRSRLAEELGADPSAPLRRLHEQILRGDRELAAPAARRPDRGRNDLPRDLADFTGRDAELRRLLDAVPAPGTASTALVIAAIDGMAGVGKTALAVHAAHRLSDRYPDAQLFVNLRGHSADSPAVDATAALDTLLRALDVPGERIPADLDGRSALWRAKLAERRAVVVLDDAADAAQVRPLLPGTAHSLALVTSRRQLVDLDAARTVSLDVLPHADAVELFRRIVDDERVSAEPDAVDEAVRLCGYLPLAIRIAAARLRSRPTWTVRHLVRRLTEGRPLAELTAGERSVGAAFTVSYQQLTPPQRRLFGLLGLHPGADFDACSAAALAALAVPAADRLLEELLDVHLVHQVTAGRYRFHDLVRQHARDSGHRDEPEGERWCAVTRLLDHYLHTSYAGDRWLYPHRPTITLGAPADGCAVRPLDGDQAALDWFDGEYAGLLAAQRLATEQRRHDYVWRLAWTLTGYRRRRGHFRDSLDAWSLGLAAAQRLGDPVAEVQARRYLGYAHTLQGDHPEALRHLHRALALTEDLGDTANRGHTHYTLAKVRAAQGDQERALAEATRALELFEGLDNPVWLADALNTVGWYHACLGHFAEAESCCSAALALHRQQGDLSGEAHTLDSLGYVAYRAGRYAQALDRYRDALRVRRRIGATSDEADTLAQLGEIHAALGDHPGARGAWQQALDLYREQHRADDAERMRHRLAAPDPSLV